MDARAKKAESDWLSEFAGQLDIEEKDRLFKRWEEEIGLNLRRMGATCRTHDLVLIGSFK